MSTVGMIPPARSGASTPRLMRLHDPHILTGRQQGVIVGYHSLGSLRHFVFAHPHVDAEIAQ